MVGDRDAQPAIEAAEAARAEILREPDVNRRAELIGLKRDRWVAFREHFQRIFGNKCWYVECENPGTDDDIDHYRPKGRLAEDTAHDGYWWEALHWRNFRLSCHRANRLRINPDTAHPHGKGDHFPLLREEDRCRQPEDDLYRERPTLLDPTDPADPPLLTFDIDGGVALSPRYEGDAEALRRIEDSRIYLHLDWPAFKTQRQTLYRTVAVKVGDGDAAYERWARGEAGARGALRGAARDLIRLTDRGSPYSRAAQAYIHYFRDRDWIQRYVIANILPAEAPEGEGASGR